MIILREEKIEENNEIGYIDVIFDSSNILKTTYFPKKSKLYIHFKRGGTYSYLNIDSEFYNKFENAESQGKFLAKEIRPNAKKYPFKKEYTLQEYEINEINIIIENHKKNG